MPSWPNEVQASMDTKVALISTHRLLLLPHVDFVLVVNKVDDGRPRLAVIDIVAETGCVNHGELDLERLLDELGLDDLNLAQN